MNMLDRIKKLEAERVRLSDRIERALDDQAEYGPIRDWRDIQRARAQLDDVNHELGELLYGAT
jgi:hypothetical protein